MVGADVKDPFPMSNVKPGAKILEARACSDPNGAFHNVSFDLRAAEIISFAGLLGSANEEFDVHALMRPRRTSDRKHRVVRASVCAAIAVQATRSGLFYLPADRKTEGLVMPLSVTDNVRLAALYRYTKNGILSIDGQESDAATYQRKLGIKTPTLKTPVGA